MFWAVCEFQVLRGSVDDDDDDDEDDDDDDDDAEGDEENDGFEFGNVRPAGVRVLPATSAYD
jgi:hypothetical protein